MSCTVLRYKLALKKFRLGIRKLFIQAKLTNLWQKGKELFILKRVVNFLMVEN